MPPTIQILATLGFGASKLLGGSGKYHSYPVSKTITYQSDRLIHTSIPPQPNLKRDKSMSEGSHSKLAKRSALLLHGGQRAGPSRKYTSSHNQCCIPRQQHAAQQLIFHNRLYLIPTSHQLYSSVLKLTLTQPQLPSSASTIAPTPTHQIQHITDTRSYTTNASQRLKVGTGMRSPIHPFRLNPNPPQEAKRDSRNGPCVSSLRLNLGHKVGNKDCEPRNVRLSGNWDKGRDSGERYAATPRGNLGQEKAIGLEGIGPGF